MSSGATLLLAVLATLSSGLVAGAFFAFSTFVMKALGRLPPPQGIAAMQSINVTVFNPWFMGVFVGGAALAVVELIVAIRRWGEPGAAWLLAGALLYAIGCFAVTIAFNVPRNDALAAAGAESAEAAKLWADYLRDWTFWNHVRTAAAFASAASYLGAAIAGAA